MPKPVISVIVPAYNEEKYIESTLEALVAQQFDKPYEIIVVDNNSTDNTVQVAKKWGVRVIRESKRGVVHAKQAGVIAAAAPIVAICDADTVPNPQWLALIRNAFEDKKIVGVSGPVDILDGPKWHRRHNTIGFKMVEGIYKTTGKVVYIIGANISFRKKILLKEGGYNTSGGIAEDELGLLGKLKRHGRIKYDRRLKSVASGRRASKGPAYYYLYELPIKYLAGYYLGRIFNRSVVPEFTPFR